MKPGSLSSKDLTTAHLDLIQKTANPQTEAVIKEAAEHSRNKKIKPRNGNHTPTNPVTKIAIMHVRTMLANHMVTEIRKTIGIKEIITTKQIPDESQ